VRASRTNSPLDRHDPDEKNRSEGRQSRFFNLILSDQYFAITGLPQLMRTVPRSAFPADAIGRRNGAGRRCRRQVAGPHEQVGQTPARPTDAKPTIHAKLHDALEQNWNNPDCDAICG
jgi:hypothetical protein